jgi:hypothetical protein
VTTLPLSELSLGLHWTEECRGGRGAQLGFDDEDGGVVRFRAGRCIDGRLRDAYPVSAHDVELEAVTTASPHRVTRPLAALSQTILKSDPQCRRIVVAAPARDQAMAAAVQAAGFRYVLDVDVPGEQLSLFVLEPLWVTALDDDRVPGS